MLLTTQMQQLEESRGALQTDKSSLEKKVSEVQAEVEKKNGELQTCQKSLAESKVS